ncbi:hypothetical protein [Nocardiopsis sp. NPDC006938]|uniref:hypothetical protein n=1 Tax=Nocardiopsis sp. NPDC006938 TaxID=3364337 RepID=UPI0036B9B210
MESPRSALLLTCALSATLAVPGCALFPGADRPWYEEADTEALLAVLPDTVAGADDYTLDIGVGTGPEGGTATLLTYEVSASPAAVRATLSTPGSPELVVVRPEDGQALLHDPGRVLGAPTDWVRGDALVPSPSPADVFDLGSVAEVVALLSGMEGVEPGPAETVAGTGTLPLHGVLPALADGADPQGRAVVGPMLGEEGSGRLDVSVWVDSEGFPVRLESSGPTSSLWLEFSDRGATSFHVPNGDEISESVPT